MNAWLALLAVAGIAGCGARTGLYAPDVDGGPEGSCAGVGPTPIFVVSDQAQLFRFDPSSAAFTLVGAIDCTAASSPASMAVDRGGTGYVTFEDGSMFEVSTETASCTPTAFMGGQNNGGVGSCFLADAGGQGERLFMAENFKPDPDLVVVDTQAFGTSLVGSLPTDLGAVELTSAGDGRLFAFGDDYEMTYPPERVLAELSPTDATVLSAMPLAFPSTYFGFAFAFWGGDFYFFTGNADGNSTVARLAADGSFDASYAALSGQNLVGAGVSPCAPLH